jgi:predicted nucleic acid-binding protein
MRIDHALITPRGRRGGAEVFVHQLRDRVGGLAVGEVADPVERAARQARLPETENAVEPLPFDAAATRVFGRVTADLRRGGRRVSARAFDALIAATAIANDLPVFTCNPRDFAGIETLTVVPGPHPDGG